MTIPDGYVLCKKGHRPIYHDERIPCPYCYVSMKWNEALDRLEELQTAARAFAKLLEV